MSQELFYLQNRGFSGDCLMWWRDGGHGYTTDLNKAWKVTREQAEKLCRPGQDRALPVESLDAISERHINSESDGYRELTTAWGAIARVQCGGVRDARGESAGVK